MKKASCFELKGAIQMDDPITFNEFFDAFVELMESKGWAYGGGIQALDDEGEPIPYQDMT